MEDRVVKHSDTKYVAHTSGLLQHMSASRSILLWHVMQQQRIVIAV